MGLVNTVYWSGLCFSLPDRNFSSSPAAASKLDRIPPLSFLQRSFGSLRPLCYRSRFRVPARSPRRSAPTRSVLCGSVDLASPASGSWRRTSIQQSEHPGARRLFFSADRAQGQAVVGRIGRLRIRPVPASDLEVERTRYDRLKNPFADEPRYHQVKIQRVLLKTRPGGLPQIRSADLAFFVTAKRTSDNRWHRTGSTGCRSSTGSKPRNDCHSYRNSADRLKNPNKPFSVSKAYTFCRRSFARLLEFGLCSGSHELSGGNDRCGPRQFRSALAFCVLEIRSEESKLVCVGAEGREFALSRLVGANVRIGDEVLVPELSTGTAAADTEVYIRKPSLRRPTSAKSKVGYAALPKMYKLRRTLFRACSNRRRPLLEIWNANPCPLPGDSRLLLCRQSESVLAKPAYFYYVLRLPQDVGLIRNLRLAYRLRRLEFPEAERYPKLELATIELGAGFITCWPILTSIAAYMTRFDKRFGDSCSIPLLRFRISVGTGRKIYGEWRFLCEPNSGLHAGAPAPYRPGASPQT